MPQSSSETKRIVITGANRGIGLELVKCYAASGDWMIEACCRNPQQADALNQLARHHKSLRVHSLDVTNQTSVNALADGLKDLPVHLLINNAGIYTDKDQALSDLDYADWALTFEINTIAPVRVAQGLLPNLEAANGAKLVTISSQMGSLLRARPGSIAYRSSKAAVNKAMQVLALEWADKKIVTCPMHPGWVRTDMGGPQGDITPQQSAQGLYDVIEKLTMEDNGRFWCWNGDEHPW